MKAILGKKIGMTQIFTASGKMVPVTAIEATPNFVIGHRTPERDGYQAVVLGFGAKKRTTKPLAGQLKAVGIDTKVAKITEFAASGDLPEITSTVDITAFAPGDFVDVTGVSKGKGYAGVIKRHGFSRGPETHGSDHHRKPGSIGQMFPQRVVAGKKMPGHMGSQRITVSKLEVMEVHPDKHILLIKGAVPGSNGTVLEIRGRDHV